MNWNTWDNLPSIANAHRRRDCYYAVNILLADKDFENYAVGVYNKMRKGSRVEVTEVMNCCSGTVKEISKTYPYWSAIIPAKKEGDE